ncbi:MAG: acetyl-CoA carboxylase biotin carboxyl carrier protein [Ruminococcus sp.]|nr:acetyl-CoA carboxylase biotin carboxyl carrier protein [Ruminococcus sp.]
MIDIETLKDYIKVLEDSSLAEIEISDEEDSIRLAKPSADSPVVAFAPSNAPAAAQAVPASAPAASGKAIKSPMVGVFYAAPSPDRPPFVNVGDTVKKGDVVCIIEAMKIMNEITATESGTITEVLVENGDVVEYDQPLFTIG